MMFRVHPNTGSAAAPPLLSRQDQEDECQSSMLNS